MQSTQQRLGAFGETIAKCYLEKKEYTIVDINYRKPYGEIDIIARKGALLLFCEVKTIKEHPMNHFLPEQKVNRQKMRKLRQICETYLREKHYPVNQQWQIDILAITINNLTKRAKITHFENAVGED